MCGLWRQFKFARLMGILSGRTVIGTLIRRKIVRWWTSLLRPTRRPVKRIVDDRNTSSQIVVNMAELPVALQLIRGEAETCEHDDENQAIPNLQPPFDGVENFHSMQ